jgi:hypothetical protein
MDTQACLSQPTTPSCSRKRRTPDAAAASHAMPQPSRICFQIDAVVADEHGPRAGGRQRRADSFPGRNGGLGASHYANWGRGSQETDQGLAVAFIVEI